MLYPLFVRGLILECECATIVGIFFYDWMCTVRIELVLGLRNLGSEFTCLERNLFSLFSAYDISSSWAQVMM